MTQRERQILRWIEENPLISQQELADKAGITRSSAAVHISNLMKQGHIAGKGYIVRTAPYVVVVGGVNLDIGGRSLAKLVPEDSNPGQVRTSLGGVGRNIAHNMALLGLDVRLLTAFGDDLVDSETGELDRSLLAKRAFESEESTALLERIELPHIRDMLLRMLTSGICGQTEPVACVVEVPLLDRMESMLDLADEVVVVTCPLEVRRSRAEGRGMDPSDFDRRVSGQPTDDYLRAHADTVISNTGDESSLLAEVNDWWASHGWS